MMQRNVNKSRDWKGYVRSIFLRYVNDHPATFQTAYFPPFFQRELDLSDCYSYLRRMYRMGYLEKREDGCLALTERGQQTIREDHLRLFDLADPYVTVSEYMEEKKALGEDEPFDSTMLALLLKKLPQMKEQDNFNAVKNIHLDVASLYEALKVPDQAMYHYLTTLYYDVSGLDVYDQLVRYIHGKTKRSDVKAAFRGLVVRPEVTAALHRLQDAFDASMVGRIYEKDPLSINLLTRAEFTELAQQLCLGTYDYNEWKKKGEAAFDKILVKADRFRKEK